MYCPDFGPVVNTSWLPKAWFKDNVEAVGVDLGVVHVPEHVLHLSLLFAPVVTSIISDYLDQTEDSDKGSVSFDEHAAVTFYSGSEALITAVKLVREGAIDHVDDSLCDALLTPMGASSPFAALAAHEG